MEVAFNDTLECEEEKVWIEDTSTKPSKRGRDMEESSEDEWATVIGSKKKLRQGIKESNKNRENIRNVKSEIYITCQEVLPKQFALARLLKDSKISDIASIKYLNPYKIRIQFNNEESIAGLISNEVLINKGWRYSRSSEVSFSYGVIKDVDLELSTEEILQNITCPESVELVSLKRLDRINRDKDSKSGKWSPSETVRLCFKGSYLPQFVYVHDMKVIINPYVYPVTQCFKCWRLGHTVKTCNVKKEVCPKCSGDHANCETTLFKCVNCMGRHMAMSKICPAFQKEKRIREIMAEHNYTYSKASSVYVTLPNIFQPEITTNPQAKIQVVASSNSIHPMNETPAPVDMADTESISSSQSVILPARQPKKTIKKTIPSSSKKSFNWNNIEEETESCQQNLNSDEQPPEKINFSELLSRIKEVIFLNNLDLQSKVKSVIQLFVEWLILVAVDNFSDWPIARLIYNLVKHNA